MEDGRLRNSSESESEFNMTEEIISHMHIIRTEYKYEPGNILYVFFMTCLLWLSVPGCGFFYSGLSRRGSGLSVILVTFWSMALVSIQWYLLGYSLAFSPTPPSPFIGDLSRAFLIGVQEESYVGEEAAREIPEILFCFYQGVTAGLGPALILGVISERGRMAPALAFILIWTTFVYDPLAAWSLNPRGWSARLGGQRAVVSCRM
jgi:Amt family ammonium transporter